MNQSQNSGKHQQRIEEFLRRREARLDDQIARIHQASVYTRQQYTQTAQPPSIEEPDHSNVIEGTWFVVGSPSDSRYQQELNHIEALRQAVFGDDARILSAWVLAIICGCYGRYLLALDLLGLAGILFYLKFIRAAKAKCPSCQQPFGSSQWLPTKLGGDVCQNPHCGLPIKAMK